MFRRLRAILHKLVAPTAPPSDVRFTPPDRLTRLSVLYKPAPLPEGLPSVYGVAAGGDKYIVTVNDIPTSAPRWETFEDARRDAWERHWADARGAVALAAFNARAK